MRVSFRTAAVAAGATCLCAVAGFTAPSFATEVEAAPAISYLAHADSALMVDNIGLNDLPQQQIPTDDAFGTQPVAVHAMAPALPSADSEEAPATGADLEALPLDALVAELSGTQTPDAETDCLARAVYYESKGEPLTGQLTVAEVIINRARSGRFPSTICGVVRQPGQFSFVRRGSIPTPPASSRDWRVAVGVAQVAIRGLADGAAPRALFFHARHVRPGWRLTRVATVGNHIFYR
ncbi:cell wall hydrolase [Sphingosinicella terrae]|uniref:cell wall hydrolase n=1 Tax=Sphingosinicella terrae TaxID=2172047 RepID=UPI002548FB4D|nr:cell wall hydrolase [Sphingosinicella terrae]